ncbi:MAG: hypothetical protein IJJ33_05570 [Victivallales bacterium]|nr:hypothetical protein [Victivallales bacterium]
MTDMDDKEMELRSAEALAPKLERWSVSAKNVVYFVPNLASWQNLGVITAYPAKYLPDQLLAKDTKIFLDFGETLVGKVRLRLECICQPDTPIRLKTMAAELPYEAVNDPETYQSGLGRGWLQEEMLTAYEMPMDVVLPRRYSLRYLAITVLACPRSGVKITSAEVVAQSAAGKDLPPPLPDWDREMALIDLACFRTLRNCMQEVLEDGPKRDRRLWLGDLRLQALVNHVTFHRYDQVERCIRLLCACTDERGRIPSAVLLKPHPCAGGFLLDYALIFARLLLEHCKFTGSLALAEEWFDLARLQLSFFREGVDDQRLFHASGCPRVFIDHCPALDRDTPATCVAIWSAEALAELAQLLKRPAKEIAALKTEAAEWRQALRDNRFDSKSGMLQSGHSRQLSWASQFWGILAGVLSPEEARAALTKWEQQPEMAVKPNTPYLMHYLLEACRKCGMEELLQNTIRRYWGGMILRGADTFWEVFQEDDDFYTPYCDTHDPRNNSACHAWSGTPSFFIRK